MVIAMNAQINGSTAKAENASICSTRNKRLVHAVPNALDAIVRQVKVGGGRVGLHGQLVERRHVLPDQREPLVVGVVNLLDLQLGRFFGRGHVCV